jgi:aminoglycoside phosphotransferase (APT) family kinase protein
VELVSGLLRKQHHDLSGLPLRVVAEGWANVTLRLGDELAVRVPRREASAKLIENEIAWLPKLGPFLSVSVPVAVRNGRSTDDYPPQWSVVPWFDGKQALSDPLLPSEAARLGSFL